MARSTLFDIDVIVHHETDKSWLVSTTGDRSDAVFVPKSQCETSPASGALDPRLMQLTLPEWLAKEKGFI